MTDNYIPYGDEWEKEMMKWSKALLIATIRKQWMDKEGQKDVSDEVLFNYIEKQKRMANKMRSSWRKEGDQMRVAYFDGKYNALESLLTFIEGGNQ